MADPLMGSGSRLWLVIRWLHRRQRAAFSRLVDRALRVRTTPDEPGGPLTPLDPAVFGIQPTGWLTLWRVFRWLDPEPDDVLLDVGSGAGRAAFVASLFPFRRIVGLELSEEIHRLAEANRRRFRLAARERISFVLADAARYGLSDDVSVVFLYNPFGRDVLRRFLRRIFESLARSPRHLVLIYVNPVHHDLLLETGRCRLIKRFRGLRPTREWARMLATHVYVVGPAVPGVPGDHTCHEPG